MAELATLVEGIQAGDMRALARACRLIDERDPRAFELLKQIFSHSGHAYVIGVTGTPGAGKSTLVDGLIRLYREEGKRVGLLQICSYRPFPRRAVYDALKDKMNIVVLEKCISLGRGGILASDVRWSFPRAEKKDRNISSFVAGLRGRNISMDHLRHMVEKVEREPVEFEFLGLQEQLIAERDM